MDDEVIVLKFCVPSHSSVVEFSRVLPECKVGVICEDNELMLPPCEVWSPVFQGFEYCIELLFVDVIFLLGRGERGQVEGDRV